MQGLGVVDLVARLQALEDGGSRPEGAGDEDGLANSGP